MTQGTSPVISPDPVLFLANSFFVLKKIKINKGILVSYGCFNLFSNRFVSSNSFSCVFSDINCPASWHMCRTKCLYATYCGLYHMTSDIFGNGRHGHSWIRNDNVLSPQYELWCPDTKVGNAFQKSLQSIDRKHLLYFAHNSRGSFPETCNLSIAALYEYCNSYSMSFYLMHSLLVQPLVFLKNNSTLIHDCCSCSCLFFFSG